MSATHSGHQIHQQTAYKYTVNVLSITGPQVPRYLPGVQVLYSASARSLCRHDHVGNLLQTRDCKAIWYQECNESHNTILESRKAYIYVFGCIS